MLILTRKLNEEIRINGDIVVKIVALSDNQVKIGIDAPGDIKILRGEVYEKVRDYTIEASQKSQEKPSVDLNKLKVNKIKK
ncbi:MAG: carbon storage regulator CsrA [Syntrophomonadaceae bacterium]